MLRSVEKFLRERGEVDEAIAPPSSGEVDEAIAPPSRSSTVISTPQ
jgi:hypothetical protein